MCVFVCIAGYRTIYLCIYICMSLHTLCFATYIFAVIMLSRDETMPEYKNAFWKHRYPWEAVCSSLRQEGSVHTWALDAGRAWDGGQWQGRQGPYVPRAASSPCGYWVLITPLLDCRQHHLFLPVAKRHCKELWEGLLCLLLCHINWRLC